MRILPDDERLVERVEANAFGPAAVEGDGLLFAGGVGVAQHQHVRDPAGSLERGGEGFDEVAGGALVAVRDDQVDVAGPQFKGGEGFGDVVRLVDREARGIFRSNSS